MISPIGNLEPKNLEIIYADSGRTCKVSAELIMLLLVNDVVEKLR